MEELLIKKIENNSKDKIEQPRLSEQNIIPRINTANIFVGTTGMGKSTLVANLMSKPQFFGGKRKDGGDWFDKIILISPTGDSDDVQKDMKVDLVLTDMDEVPGELIDLMRIQKKVIKESGADKAPKICLLYDDVISNPKLMRNKHFIKTFIANRHFNFTVLLCTQSWTKVPRAVRLQARGIFYFPGGISEVELLCDEYCPPGLWRNDFRELVSYATESDYSFLFINKSTPIKNRYRRNLHEIINLDFFKGSKQNKEFVQPHPEETEENKNQPPDNQEDIRKEEPDSEEKDKDKESEEQEREHNPAYDLEHIIEEHNKKQAADNPNRPKKVVTKRQHESTEFQFDRVGWRGAQDHEYDGRRAKKRSKRFGPKRLKSCYSTRS